MSRKARVPGAASMPARARLPRRRQGSVRHSWLAAVRLPISAEALSAVLVTRLLTCFVVFLSLVSLRALPGLWSVDPNNLLLTGLVRHNGWDFTAIARDGYGLPPAGHRLPASAAFFPLYPLLVHVVGDLVSQIYWPAVLISNLAFLAACGVFYRLVEQEADAPTAGRAVFYLAAAPAAIYFCAAYAESLFLLLVVLTFSAAARQRWGVAALAGALAAATRNTGVLLALVVALEGLHQQGLRWRPPAWLPRTWLPHLRAQWPYAVRAWQSLLAAACVPLGLLAYMVYLGRTYGDPLGFIHAESTWNRDVSGGGFLHLVGHIQDRLQIRAPSAGGPGEHRHLARRVGHAGLPARGHRRAGPAAAGLWPVRAALLSRTPEHRHCRQHAAFHPAARALLPAAGPLGAPALVRSPGDLHLSALDDLCCHRLLARLPAVLGAESAVTV